MATITVSSASEHGEPMSEKPMPWTGNVAIANIGLSGQAIMGGRWEHHRRQLLQQFKRDAELRQRPWPLPSRGWKL